MVLPITQSIRLRWRPELRFYEQRIPILRQLEDQGILEAFRVGDDYIDARLLGAPHELSVRQDGITLDLLSPTDKIEEAWSVVRLAVEAIEPTRFIRARASYQHIVELPLEFDEAIARGHVRLYRSLGTQEVRFGDWAFLGDIEAAGPPVSKGSMEFGIVRRHEVPSRLERQAGRGPGLSRSRSTSWTSETFKDVSLFADTNLIFAVDGDQKEAFMDEAYAFWEASRTQVCRLVMDIHSRLVGNDKDKGGLDR